MYEHQDIIKKINMKIAGTLPQGSPSAPAVEEEEKVENHESGTSAKNENMTSKQKKNQKKKEQKRRKKQETKIGDLVSAVGEEDI